MKKKGPRGSRSAPYWILTPAQRFQVGKKAAEHGFTLQICRVMQMFTMFYRICFPRYFHFTICQIFFTNVFMQ